MCAARVLSVAVWSSVLIASISATQTKVSLPMRHPKSKTSDIADTLARGEKMDKMTMDLYKGFMVAKNLIGFMLMFVGPIVQVKGFGLQVINTIVNIARLVLQVQASDSSHHQIHLTQQPYSPEGLHGQASSYGDFTATHPQPQSYSHGYPAQPLVSPSGPHRRFYNPLSPPQSSKTTSYLYRKPNTIEFR